VLRKKVLMPRRSFKFSIKPCLIGMSALALVMAPISLDSQNLSIKVSTAIAKGGGGGDGGDGGGSGDGGDSGGNGGGGGSDDQSGSGAGNF
jgi:hypothetical protein